MSQDVLDQVISVLVAGDVDERNAWTVAATLANTVKVATEKLDTSNLETLLDNLGCKLVHAVLRGVPDDVVNGTAAISWSAVLADVLNAPVAELAVSDNIDASKDFLNTWTL